MDSDRVLGIDFGTAYTSGGVLVGDRVELVQDAGDPAVPSVVYAPARGELEIGRRAQMRILQDPAGVIRSVKRVLGVTADAPIVRRFAPSCGVPLGAHGDKLLFKLRSGEAAPEQIVGAILARIRDLAERRFGGQIRRALITTSVDAPAGYRDALTRAARVAHLDLLEIVPEPVAGALAVGLHGEPMNRKLLVCDFGGGTFDVCALVQAGLRFTPVATAGDQFLGGDDLDEALANGIAGAVFRRDRIEMQNDHARWSELLFRSECAKRQLSSVSSVRFAMKQAYTAHGAAQDISCEIDRPWAEARWTSLMERVSGVIADTLALAGWRPQDVERVALIGGSSQVPAFQRVVAAAVPGRPLLVATQSELSVAVGATLLTARHLSTPRAVPVLGAA